MDKFKLPHNHGQYIDKLANCMSQTNNFEILADIFKLLSDSSRIQIFWILCHCEECVIDISAIVNMTSPAVSHHLKLLKASGLITSRREGKEVYYTAAKTEQAHLLHKAIESLMEISCPSPEDM